MRHNIKTNVTQ